VFFLKGKYGLNEQFKKVGLKNCCISEVTLAELKYGAECSDRTDENMRMVDDFPKFPSFATACLDPSGRGKLPIVCTDII
jgi:hypothetical protein